MLAAESPSEPELITTDGIFTSGVWSVQTLNPCHQIAHQRRPQVWICSHLRCERVSIWNFHQASKPTPVVTFTPTVWVLLRLTQQVSEETTPSSWKHSVPGQQTKTSSQQQQQKILSESFGRKERSHHYAGPKKIPTKHKQVTTLDIIRHRAWEEQVISILWIVTAESRKCSLLI